MKQLAWLGLAALALLTSSCASSVYSSGSPQNSPYANATYFNGDWRLVASRSDNGRDWIDERNRFDPNDWGWNSGTTDNDNDNDNRSDRFRYGASYGMWFLPDQIRIEGDAQTLQIEDGNGSQLAE